MPYEICNRQGCGKAAQFAPEIYVPGIGVPVESRKWPSVILGLKLCGEHAATFDAKEIVQEGMPMQTAFKVAFNLNPNFKPDFDRVFVNAIPLDGERFGMFERQSAKDKK